MRFAALLALAMALYPSAGSAESPRLVVLRFTGDGIDKTILDAATASAETAALHVVNGRLKVVTRDMLAAIVGEQTLLKCEAEARCELDLGVGLGTGYLLAGSIRKLPRRFEITAKLYDVRKLELLQQDSEPAAREEDLLDHVEPLVQRVLRTGLALGAPRPGGIATGPFEERSGVRSAAGPDRHIVQFVSTPPGATVRVDGALLCSAAPCAKRLAAGAHVAVFEKERYAPATVKFTSARNASVSGTLVAGFGWISVETEPPGVRIAIDGTDAGVTPLHAYEADPGDLEVAISDPCWTRSGERIALAAGERRTVKLRPRPRVAGLKVETEDRAGNAVESTVTVDRAAVGPAGTQLEVPVCSRNVEVTIGGDTVSQPLSLEEGKVTTMVLRPPARISEEPRRAAEPVAGGGGPPPPPAKVLYGVGLALAKSVAPFSFSPAEVDTLEEGIRDAWAGDLTAILDGNQQPIDDLVRARKRSASAPAPRATIRRVGGAVAESLTVFDLTRPELDQVLKGLREALAGKPRYPYDAALEGAVSELARSRGPKSAERAAAREKKAGPEYLARVSRERGARKTASGAIVFTEQEGTGATPAASDKVKVNYTGTLVSGRVFDASARHGGPAEFPLSGVIKCWTEALQLMRAGGKARIVCPSETAYGSTGNQAIPGNAVLTFEVELLDVVK